jgi:hypothetical protein
MPVHPNFNPDYLYFVTTSAERHIHIFKHEGMVRIILDSWHFLRTSGRMKLFAFVVMPTHLHFIGKFSQEILFQMSYVTSRDIRPDKSFVKYRQRKTQNCWRYFKALTMTTDRNSKYGRMDMTHAIYSPLIFLNKRWSTFITIPAAQSGIWQVHRRNIRGQAQGFIF